MPYRARPRICAASVVLAAGFGCAPAPASAALGNHVLHEGSHGQPVRALQRWLTVVGHPTHVDGHFGASTRRAVRRYERAQRLRVDGVVSPLQSDGLRVRVIAARERAAVMLPTLAQSGMTDRPAAVIGPDGRSALVPVAAPAQVRDAILAANRIVGRPYVWGGGHGSFEAPGYDCSGTVSYALHGAGLADTPLDSGGLAAFGAGGPGRWITIYANGGHAYAVIAGLRLDTSGAGEEGPRWRPQPAPAAGFAVRHPPGL